MKKWVQRRLHVSYFFGWAAFGVVIGVFLAQFAGLSLWALLLAMVCGGIALWWQRVVLIPLVLLAGMIAGWCQGSVYKRALLRTEAFVGRSVVLEGVITEDVTASVTGGKQLTLGSIHINGQAQTGTVQAAVSRGSFVRGDEVVIRGVVTPGFGSATVTVYQATILSVKPGHDSIVAVRDWFVAAVRRTIKEPEASLGVGYLVGQKSALPLDLVTALQVAGLTHVVVASGYNLTILVRLSRRLLMRISKFVALFGSVVLVGCMMGVTGLSPSMTRAGLVTGLSLATWYYGRSFHPMILLSIAAAVTSLWQPSYVWHDLGWALSFTAFAGVMIIAPLLHHYFFGEEEPGTVRQILGETVAAHLATAPLIVLVFGQVSNVALFTNMLILPLVPLAMLLTFLAGIVTILLPVLTPWAGLPAQWLLGYMVWVTHYFADLPWAQTLVKAEWTVVVGVYVAILGMMLYMWRVTRHNFRGSSVVT